MSRTVIVLLIIVICLAGWHFYIEPLDQTFNNIQVTSQKIGDNIIGSNPLLTIARDGSGNENIVREIEEKVHYYTNQERIAAGLPTLPKNVQLQEIARKHSEDMAKNNYFSHTNLQGQSPSDRALAAGYISSTFGENLFLMPAGNVIGIGYVNKYDVDQIAREVVNGWMESSGHRQNILYSHYTQMGIGVASKGNQYYITQNFS